MRAPRFVQEFFDWRWATCVVLIAAALAFVALALLLIPTRIGGAPFQAAAQGAVVPVATERVLIATQPIAARAWQNSDAAATRESVRGAGALGLEGPVRLEPSEPPQEAVYKPDFAQNIAERGDRPTRPSLAGAQAH